MPKRKSPFVERPWKPDPVKWQRHLEKPKGDLPKREPPVRPKKGWQLWNWITLEDAKQ